MGNYEWVPLYEEFADKLLAYKDDLPTLAAALKKAYAAAKAEEDTIQYPFYKNGGFYDDLDPFSIFGVFNSGKPRPGYERKRMAVLRGIKGAFSLAAAVPERFDGIPLLFNMNTWFRNFTIPQNELATLWNLFRAALELAADPTAPNEARFISLYDAVQKQPHIKWNITSALFWIRPYFYPTLDKYSRAFLSEFGFSLDTPPDGAGYLKIRRDCLTRFGTQWPQIDSFTALSDTAYRNDTGEIAATVNENTENRTQMEKNLILYGPPGMGKTYKTVYYAVAIIENKAVEGVLREPYPAVKKRYDDYKKSGLIEFVTFHQSYGYEEFVEGIRPVLDEEEEGGELRYKLRDGVFKAFCKNANIPEKASLPFREMPTIWKVSLAGTGDNEIRRYCFENDCIRIGHHNYGDSDPKNGGKKIVNAIKNYMEPGDIVLSCYSDHEVDGIGVVDGPYEWREDFPEYKRLRKVKWLVKNIRYAITDRYDARLTLAAVYKLRMTPGDVVQMLEDLDYRFSGELKNRVLIIDEINRGNISKIFGELITLLEPTKRLGAAEAITVRLPYSQDHFGVPENVYILGTMNTADKSIAAVDTALRRRFEFIETKPDYDLLENIIIEKQGVCVDIARMLRAINERIAAIFDRHHILGHSYFLPLAADPKFDKLKQIFEFKVVPLLEDYFYADYSKIADVLGGSGENTLVTERTLRATEYEETYFEINEDAYDSIDAYKKIYEA